VSPVTYFLGRLLIRGVDYIAMPNIISGWGVVTELLQEEVTSSKLSTELESLLYDQRRRDAMMSSLREMRSLLAPNTASEESPTTVGASNRVAKMVLELAGQP